MSDVNKPVSKDKIQDSDLENSYQKELDSSYNIDVRSKKMLCNRELSLIDDSGRSWMGSFGRQRMEDCGEDSDISLGYREAGDDIESVDIGRNSLFNNIAIFGRLGLGKSSLIRNIMLQSGNSNTGVCYIDTKGEDVEKFVGQIPSNRTDDIVVLRPGSGEDNSVGFNIFKTTTSKDSDDYEREVKRLSSSAMDMMKKGLEDDNIDGRVESIIEDIIQRMIRSDKDYTPEDLLTILKIIESTDGFNSFAKSFIKIEDEYDEIVDRNIMFRIVDGISFEPMYKNLKRLLKNKEVQDLIAKDEPNFRVKTSVEGGEILLIDLSEIECSTIRDIVGQTLVSRIWYTARSNLNYSTQSYLLCIDEIDCITTESFNMENILSTSMDFSLIVSVQNPASLTSNIINNMHKFQTIISYHPSRNVRSIRLTAQFLVSVEYWALGEIKNNDAYIRLKDSNTTKLIRTYPEYPPVRNSKKVREIIDSTAE